MDKKKQRIKIAETCGWKKIKEPESAKNSWGCGSEFPEYWFDYQLPDYLNDLNAMNEAERFLENNHLSKAFVYVAELKRKINKDAKSRYSFVGDFRLINAKPAQKSEAFLKALELWEEES